jgi:putative transcriptional regulator
MSNLGKRLIKAAGQARAIARGEAKPNTYRVFTPTTIDVQQLRHSLHLSQNEFAAQFGIPPGTLKDWEQGRKTPEGPARVLLTIIKQEPEVVSRALAAATKPATKGLALKTAKRLRTAGSAKQRAKPKA